MPCLAATYADLNGLATSACAEAILMMRPAFLRLHRREREADRVERRRQVERQDRVPFVDRELVDRRDVLDAGVVDEDVDGAEFRERLAHHRLDRRPAAKGRRRHSAPSRRDRRRAWRGASRSAAASPKPFRMTFAPCSANAVAMPRPMPLVEPVTSAVLPLNMSDSRCVGIGTGARPRRSRARGCLHAFPRTPQFVGAWRPRSLR